ncbi:Uncharacterised protein [Arachnia propionica]|nr:Uncharacterised protein [Arachnia propionica]
MSNLSMAEFVSWGNRLANLAWPMGLEDFTKIALGDFGWDATEGKQRFIATFATCSGQVLVTRMIEGDIRKIYFPLIRIVEGLGAEGRIQLNDYFADYSAAGMKAWGSASRVEAGEDPLVAWEHPSGGIIDLMGGEDVVLFTFYTPRGALYY